MAYLSVTQPWHGVPQPCVFGLGARGALLELGCGTAVARFVVVEIYSTYMSVLVGSTCCILRSENVECQPEFFHL